MIFTNDSAFNGHPAAINAGGSNLLFPEEPPNGGAIGFDWGLPTWPAATQLCHARQEYGYYTGGPALLYPQAIGPHDTANLGAALWEVPARYDAPTGFVAEPTAPLDVAVDVPPSLLAPAAESPPTPPALPLTPEEEAQAEASRQLAAQLAQLAPQWTLGASSTADPVEGESGGADLEGIEEWIQAMFGDAITDDWPLFDPARPGALPVPHHDTAAAPPSPARSPPAPAPAYTPPAAPAPTTGPNLPTAIAHPRAPQPMTFVFINYFSDNAQHVNAINLGVDISGQAGSDARKRRAEQEAERDCLEQLGGEGGGKRRRGGRGAGAGGGVRSG